MLVYFLKSNLPKNCYLSCSYIMKRHFFKNCFQKNILIYVFSLKCSEQYFAIVTASSKLR